MAKELDGDRREVIVDVAINDVRSGYKTGYRCPPHRLEVAPAHQRRGGTTRAEWRSESNIFGVRDRIEVALAKAMNIIACYVVQLFCSFIHVRLQTIEDSHCL